MSARNASDTWDPEVYDRFRHHRERPVVDLLAMVSAAPGGHAVDLGCGTGRYTRRLHVAVGAATTIGVDSSAAMLASSVEFAGSGVTFVEGDLADLQAPWWRSPDVVFSNAAFQWVPGHQALLPQIVERLRPGGQLAFQVPSNYDHPAHTVADQVGRDFGLQPLDREASVSSPAEYAELLHAAGLRELDVSSRIYGMALDQTDEVIAWVSGTLLTSFERRLSTPDYAAFRAEYRTRLLHELGDPTGRQPYYFAFPRILALGRRPG